MTQLEELLAEKAKLRALVVEAANALGECLRSDGESLAPASKDYLVRLAEKLKEAVR